MSTAGVKSSDEASVSEVGREGSISSTLEQQVAKGLGWLSIGLGAAEFLAPWRVGQMIGVGENSRYLPMLGVREIVSGIGILGGRHRAPWMWSRVAGDSVDLAFLGSSLNARGADPLRIMMAAIAVAGVTAVDVVCSQKLTKQSPG